jgi:hypothetical protein
VEVEGAIVPLPAEEVALAIEVRSVVAAVSAVLSTAVIEANATSARTVVVTVLASAEKAVATIAVGIAIRGTAAFASI